MISDLCTISVVRQKHVNMILMIKNIEGLVHDCSNSSALAMELFQSCSKPSKWSTRARIKNPFQVNQLSLCRNVRWIINVVMVILLERLHLSCDISRTIGTLWSGGHGNLKEYIASQTLESEQKMYGQTIAIVLHALGLHILNWFDVTYR